MANIDSLLVSNFYYLVNILTNIDNILKVDFCHLANILTNGNDKVDKFTRGSLITFNQLFMFYYQLDDTQKSELYSSTSGQSLVG